MNRDRGSNVRLRRRNAHRVPAASAVSSSWMEPLAPHEQRSTVNSPAEGDDDESVESFTALAQTSNRVVTNERDDDVNE